MTILNQNDYNIEITKVKDKIQEIWTCKEQPDYTFTDRDRTVMKGDGVNKPLKVYGRHNYPSIIFEYKERIVENNKIPIFDKKKPDMVSFEDLNEEEREELEKLEKEEDE